MIGQTFPPTLGTRTFTGTIGGKTLVQWHQEIWDSVQQSQALREHYQVNTWVARGDANRGGSAYIKLIPQQRRRSWSADLIIIKAETADEKDFLPDGAIWSVIGLDVSLARNVILAAAFAAAEECGALEAWRVKMGDEHGEISEVGQTL